jgi:xanthine dehydrogenase YagR molybdenum-binding subunit
MATAKWPSVEHRALIGKRIDRVDGPAKTTGAAKYAYDINLKGMLWARLVTSPHPLATIVSVDPAAAKAMPGVEAVWVDDALIGKEVQYIGQIVACVAARTEEIATEAATKVKVTYKTQPHQIADNDPELSKDRPSKREDGKVDEALGKAEVTHSGEYGLPVITHCCLEPHGQVSEWRNGEMQFWPSTQNVSRYADRIGETIGVEQNKIKVDCQYMGGGFGSKFNFDKWGTIGGILAKQTGKPIKLMLERDMELMIAGNRPSAFAKIKVGAQKNGLVTVVDTEVWGTGGSGGYNAPPVPYVFTKVPNQRIVGKGIRTHRGGQRAWRAPNHPQGCFLTFSALDDIAAKLGMDALEFYMLNAGQTDRPDVYRQELKIAADIIDYRRKAHLRGDKTPGSIKRGLGIAMHTWGGRGHPSDCDVTINPDGSVDVKMGTQDLGVGTRTVLGQVVGETLGLPMDAIRVQIGKNEYPVSGASGGSTTIGGISASSRLAATAALNALLEVVAPKLGVKPDELDARDRYIRESKRSTNSMSWKQACALLGPNPITKRGSNVPADSEKMGLISAQVGGVQIADVSVDIETGIVTMNEMVAVQDCGLIINMKLTESQVYGSLIMGITYALFEEAVYDNKTGQMLNADMEFYRLAGIKDVGKLTVHMMTGKGYDDRGVIGIGEPPVISPGAAIANAVANACGVRVPHLPLTPDRVIGALQRGGVI